MLVAATAPTAVPGSVIALCNFLAHNSMNATPCSWVTENDLRADVLKYHRLIRHVSKIQ